ncbi:uncharacterized protein LOC120420298 [Culex pipiens pallens]|uniref:uncharacterized protein LOC120420298 n=1 Tax=Culex pipiens pallens TaxID=42434 RepID=UPI0022AAD1D2|nr:uncharacterized protein LOC120420298 [Culex pipiens pallens]
MSSYIVKISILMLLAVQVFATQENCTDSSLEQHLRLKRWLTFQPNGGVTKLLVGFVAPVRWGHTLRRLLNMAINIQANYAIPAGIIWPHPESIFKNRLNEGAYEDRSRAQLYQLMERMFHNFGRKGRECVLRTICECSLKHNGMIGEILDVVFTPYDSDDIEEVYHQAKLNGASGLDCVETYKDCPLGHGLLEQITLLFHKYEVQ